MAEMAALRHPVIADLGILGAMKTTVSIPDRIFRSAEELAEQWGISRSALYAKALTAFIRKHEGQMITARLNEIYGKNQERSAMGAGIAALQRHSLGTDD